MYFIFLTSFIESSNILNRFTQIINVISQYYQIYYLAILYVVYKIHIRNIRIFVLNSDITIRNELNDLEWWSLATASSHWIRSHQVYFIKFIKPKSKRIECCECLGLYLQFFINLFRIISVLNIYIINILKVIQNKH